MQMIHEGHRSEVNDGGNEYVTVNGWQGYISLWPDGNNTVINHPRATSDDFASLPHNWEFVEVKSCECTRTTAESK